VGLAGVIAIETSVGAVTVNFAVPAIVPELAEIVVLPCVSVVASPTLTVATAADEELHVDDALTFCVL